MDMHWPRGDKVSAVTGQWENSYRTCTLSSDLTAKDIRDSVSLSVVHPRGLTVDTPHGRHVLTNRGLLAKCVTKNYTPRPD